MDVRAILFILIWGRDELKLIEGLHLVNFNCDVNLSLGMGTDEQIVTGEEDLGNITQSWEGRKQEKAKKP